MTQKEKIVLGVESTAHTIGVGIVNTEGKILADARATYFPKKGGILPREAADFIAENYAKVLSEALSKAKISLKEVDCFSFSQGPGLGACLKIGSGATRFLSIKHKKPLIGVVHGIGHIEIGKLCTGAKEPVVLYVSGGNTQVIALAGGRYRVFGETLDISIGNCLDQFALEAGLKHPGGPEIEKLALNGKNYIELPYIVKGMDLSFSGILTSAVKLYKTGKHSLEDLAYSLQETAFAMLIEVTERAMAHTNKKEVLITGGVAANKRFCEMLKKMAEERGAKAHYVPMEYSGDNGAMIAWAGALAFKSGVKQKIPETKIRQKFRTDEVDVTWD